MTKVLTVIHPWAALLVAGEKLWETRGWPTSYVGRVLIHASKNTPDYARAAIGDPRFTNALVDHFGGAWGSLGEYLDRTQGCIIGSVNLNLCRPVEKIRDSLDAQELAFGNYDDGRFAFNMTSPVIFDEPIPARGRLKFWDFDEAMLPGTYVPESN